jgi:hypothetical protein
LDLLFFEICEHAAISCDARITLHTLMLFYSSANWLSGIKESRNPVRDWLQQGAAGSYDLKDRYI